jgi:hypothetical protein
LGAPRKLIVKHRRRVRWERPGCKVDIGAENDAVDRISFQIAGQATFDQRGEHAPVPLAFQGTKSVQIAFACRRPQVACARERVDDQRVALLREECEVGKLHHAHNLLRLPQIAAPTRA